MARARADVGADSEPSTIGRGALPGVDQVLSASRGSDRVLAAGSAGYGLTESQAGEGAHHRMDASLAAAVRLLPALAVALRFDGRYDSHPGGDDGAVGLPSVTLLASLPVSSQLDLGGALGLSLPGQQAPSLVLDAAVVTVVALGSLRMRGGWSLLAQLGFRLDNSENAAPDVARLSQADRLALGLSELDALPMGVALSRGFGSFVVSAELSGELLVGSAAPKWLQSPLRAAVVARFAVAQNLSLELLGRIGLSQRPDYARVEPLIPVEPRLTLGVGLRFAAARSREVATVAPLRTELYGAIFDTEGEELADAHVLLRTAGLVLAAHSEADGSFRFYNLPRGIAQLHVTADGFEPLDLEVQLDRDELAISLSITRRPHASQLRGLVRSFDGAPLQAEVRVLPDGTSVSADKDGRFVLELAPGSYQVEIECSGYRTQRRKVTVQSNGVTLLNVELRALRH